MATRIQVVAHAREWLKTPYDHLGRTRKVAADCLFPLCVCEELGIKDRDGVPILGSDYKDYSNQPTDGFIHREAVRRLILKPVMDLKPGDLVITRFGGPIASHTGIVAEFRSPNYTTLTLIHCDGRNIVEHALSMDWRKRIVAAFALPGVE